MSQRWVAVCGGRDYNERAWLFATLDNVHREQPITLVIHGACCDKEGNLRGADRWAEAWAISREVHYMGIPAEWKRYKKRAGPLRNADIADLLDPCPLALVVAFPGGAGTADMVARARRKHIEVLTA